MTPSRIKEVVDRKAESVDGKACNAVVCRVRSVAKASEIVPATEVVYHAPNKMNFFKRLGGCQRLNEIKSQLVQRNADKHVVGATGLNG